MAKYLISFPTASGRGWAGTRMPRSTRRRLRRTRAARARMAPARRGQRVDRAHREGMPLRPGWATRLHTLLNGYLAARQGTFMHPAELSSVFSALADPTRRAILARLSQGEAPVKELAAPFDLSGPAITKHLNVLERAGLISRGREGQLRPCRLEPHAHAPAADWIDQCRALWEERLDRLDSYLKSVRSDSTSKARGMAPRTKPRPRTPGE